MAQPSPNEPGLSWIRPTPGFFWHADAQGRLITVNDRLRDLMGWRVCRPRGKNIFQDFPDEFWASQRRALTSLSQTTNNELVVRQQAVWPTSTKPKEIIWTVAPVLNRRGRCLGWTAWGQTVAALRKLIISRSPTRRNTEEWELWQHLNRFKSEFIAMVSHEIRTPIAIVEQLTVPLHDEMLGPLNDRQKESLVRLRSQIKRLKMIIEEILDFSQLEQKASILKYSVADLRELIDDAREFYMHLAHERGLTVSFDLPDTPLNLFMDPQRIFQVITNLINNAVKFTPTGGRVHIEVKRLSNKVRVGVFDTGVGIPPEEVPRIFERFVQLDTGKSKAKGIGLGLSIVREIILRHGGEIWAESEPGRGSRFYFTLPLFHTLRDLPEPVHAAIEDFSRRRKEDGVLISSLMINYQDLRGSMSQLAARGLKAMDRIITRTLRAAARNGRLSRWVDPQKGKVDVVASLSRDQVGVVLPLIRNRLKEYLKRHDLDQVVFLAVGAARFDLTGVSSIDASEDIVELYVGSQMRMHRRVRYTTTVEITDPQSLRQVTQSHDISLGGVCLISKISVKTDSLLRMRLYLSRIKEWIDVRGRVAWFKQETSWGRHHKVGVEFVDLSEPHRNALQKELRFYYE